MTSDSSRHVHSRPTKRARLSESIVSEADSSRSTAPLNSASYPAQLPRSSSRSRSPTEDVNDPSRSVACRFCNRRKLRCDHGEPRCGSCVLHDQECIPMDRQSRPRPTHARIESLEKQVASLKAELAAARRESSSIAVTTPHNPNLNVGPSSAGVSGVIQRDYNQEIRPVSNLSRLHVDDSGYASAHGPTSVFFDDDRRNDQTRLRDETLTPALEKEYREELTSSAAMRRQEEIVDLAAGRFDFDGVPADLAMHLLSLHWNRQHYSFMVTYRPAFMRDMSNGGPYYSKLLLNAIFFSVAKFSDRPEVCQDPNDRSTAGLRFLSRAKVLLGEALDRSSVPTIQAMLLLTSSLFAQGYQSTAWLYSGIAIRMIFDLGLQFNRSHGISPEDLEIRRRVVWSAFILDKINSLYQGRSISFMEHDIHIPYRFFDQSEELEVWSPYAFGGSRYPGSPARAMSTFSSLCSLSVIMARIISSIYGGQSAEDSEHLRSDLMTRLADWYQNMPAEILFDPETARVVPPPHVLSLHLLYHALIILLNRPFIEDMGHLSTSNPAMCWSACETAAQRITALLGRYREAFTLTRAPYLVSYTTYVACTVHVRAHQQRPRRDLSFCLEALRENARTNTGVRNMYRIVENLVRRLGVQVDVQSEDASPVGVLPTLDLDTLIRSFDLPEGWTDPALLSLQDGELPPGTRDSLFGVLGWQQ